MIPILALLPALSGLALPAVAQRTISPGAARTGAAP